MNKSNIRSKILKFIINKTLRHEHGAVFNKFEKIFYFIFFPLEYIRYYNKNSICSYDRVSELFNINGLLIEYDIIDDWKKLEGEDYLCISKTDDNYIIKTILRP